MKRLSTSLLCLMVLALAAGTGHADDDEISLYLKTGDILPGKLIKADEDGVKLDIGEGVELFVRWTYTRGDKHFELRKSITDFKKFDSVMKLADFCHEFAMDEQEAYVLTAALELDPSHRGARQRLEKLPKVEGLEPPDETVKSEPKPEPEPGIEKPLPPPTRKQFVVFVKMTKADDAAAAIMIEKFEGMDYGIGTAADHEIFVELTIDLTLTNNPVFMGVELYARYEATLAYKLYRKGEARPFSTATVQRKEIQGDNRDEARTKARREICDVAFNDIHKAIDKLR